MSDRASSRIAQVLGIPETFVLELVQFGIVTLHDDLDTEVVVERVRISWTLHDELGVNFEGIEVALHLLSVIGRDRRTLFQDR